MAVSGAESFRTQYSYDKNNRLLTETKLESSEEKETRYYYDPNGNEISQMTAVLTDASSGNGKQGSGIAVNSPYAVRKEYDLLNRLTTVQNENGISLYSYRADGLRSSKTIDGQKTSFVWDGQNMVAELSGSTVKDSYLFGIGLVSSRDNGYYTFNAHGDVTGLTNASGALTKEYHYDAFGVEINPAEDDTNPYRYAGEYFDAETGDIYLRARYYNPSIGRFSAQDSVTRVMRQMPNEQEIADPLSLNLYTYCYNSPVMYSDPSGRISAAVQMLIDAFNGKGEYQNYSGNGSVLTSIMFSPIMNGRINSHILDMQSSGLDMQSIDNQSISFYGSKNPYDLDMHMAAGLANYNINIVLVDKSMIADSMVYRYKVDVTLYDTYDFDNYRNSRSISDRLNNWGLDQQNAGNIVPYSWSVSYTKYFNYSYPIYQKQKR